MTVTPEAAALAQHLRPATPPERPLRVFMWPADSVSGCWMYRIDMPRRELLRLGHEVQTSQTMSAWAREEADVIVGQRVCTGPPSAMWQMLAAAPNRSFALVYEVDDDLFSIDPRDNPGAQVFRHPAIRQNMIDNIRLADLVTVSTEPLADVARRYNPNVVVLPNCVQASIFDIEQPLRRGKDDGRVIFGWQGSPTHRADWEVARQAVGSMLLDDERAQLKMLGTQYFDGLPLLDGGKTNRLTFMEWTPDLFKHHKRVARFDVSLAPLAPTAFNRSKSALRAIESLALGVPVIASAVPAYRGWVEDGVTGYLVDGRNEWLEAMRHLMAPWLRVRMGDAGREAARAWTIEANIDKWILAYRAAAAGRKA